MEEGGNGSLLERTAEQRELSDALTFAAEGHGCFVLIEGEAGIGKTSLLVATREQAVAGGWHVLSARGSQLEREFAFGLVRQLLAGGAGPQISGDETLDALEDGSRAASGSPASEFDRLHEVYWWIVRRVDDGPVLILVDDLQWADNSSLRFLELLAGRLDQLRLALVIASRTIASPLEVDPDEQHAEERVRVGLLNRLTAAPLARVLNPSSLSPQAVDVFLRRDPRMDPDLGPPSPAFVEACLRATAGNPLFLDELVHELGRRGLAPNDEHAPTVAQLGPRAIQRHVTNRLADQPEAYRRLAAAVAVLGPGASAETAHELAAVDVAEADAAIDGLVALQLLTVDRGLSFRHPLLATAVYQSLLPRRREQAHARAASILQSRGWAAEGVAAHYLKLDPAGDPSRVEVLTAAALAARRRAAPDSAAVYLRRALDEPAPPPYRAELYRQLANCEAYALEWDQVEAHQRESVRLAQTAEQRALGAFSLGRFLEVSQRTDEGATVLEDGLRQLDGQPVSRLAIRMRAELAGYCTVVLRRHAQWRDELTQLSAVSPEIWTALRDVVVAHEALLAAISGRPAREVAELADRALSPGRLAAELSALYVAVWALGGSGRYLDTIRHLSRAADQARSSGLAVAESLGRANLALLELWRGNLMAAQEELDAGWERAAGRDHALPTLLGVQVEVHLEQGDPEGAARVLQSFPLRPDTFGTVHGFRALFGRARYLLATNRWAAATAEFQRVGDLYSEWQASAYAEVPWRSGLARALAQQGRQHEAEALISEELRLSRAFGAPRAVGICLMAAAELTSDDQIATSREAVEVLADSEARLDLAKARAQLGEALLRVGQRREGREELRLGLEVAAECGAAGVLSAIRHSLMRAGGRPPPTRVTGLSALTPAERRVATMIVSEMTNREIARTLYVTEKTVEAHATSVFRKLGISSRGELGQHLPHLEAV